MKRALVLGGAESIHRDAEAALRLFEPDIIVAVNDAGVVCGCHIDHWVTLHPSELPQRMARRQSNGFPMGFETWSHKRYKSVIDHVRCYWEGSSGLFGVKVALELADKVVLAGIPMDTSHHIEGGLTHENRKGKGWGKAEDFRMEWMRVRGRRAKPHPMLAGSVKSMSGWTRNMFGAPTVEWLYPGMLS